MEALTSISQTSFFSGFLTTSHATSSTASLSSNGIASPMCAEKPGLRQAKSLRASCSEIACRSMSLDQARQQGSRNSFISVSPSQVEREWNAPSSQKARAGERMDAM